MMSWLGWLLAAVFGLAACRSGSPPEKKDERGQPERGANNQDAAQERPNEVRISGEAVQRAGIRVGPVERRAITSGGAIPAEVQFDPSSTAHVNPIVPGRFTKIVARLGDQVKRGQLLATVASTDVAAARARLEQAVTRLAAAEATLRRQQQLASEGIGAQRALLEAQSQVSELRSEVAGLRRQMSIFGSGNVGEMSLVAPIDGVVAQVNATLGETGGPDQPAFVVTDPSKVWVRGNVPELEIAHVQIGAAAVVRVHAFPDVAMHGTLNYVAPSLEENTRSLPVRVMLDKPDPRLRSGLFGSIELVGGPGDERALAVPVDALATLDGQQVVFVPSDEPNSFRPQTVEVGRRSGGFFEVRSGLTEGAAIVLSGAFTLKSALKSSELSEGE